MQTILGYGGAIGKPLATALADHTDHVRCVARTQRPLPRQVGTHYEFHAADLLDPTAARRAIAGSEIVYLIVGLPYRTAVWQRDWPQLMENVITGCTAANARLVFLDNVYALDPEYYDGMAEDAPLAPTSEKGKVRKKVLEQLTAADLPTLITRAADFRGDDIENSLYEELIVKRLADGKAAQWLGDPDLVHSFTHTPTAARALATLGNDPPAYGQTWNLPTDPERLTIRQHVARVAERLGVPPKIQVLPRPLWWLLSRFNADLRELYDVRAQVDRDYWMDAGKYFTHYG